MLPSEVFNLFNLRYLGLRDTAIGILPEAIGRLQNLQVLDAVNSDLSYLPKNVAKLQKLRYLYAGTVAGAVEGKPFGGVKVPNGIRNLTALQALQSVKASSQILCEVGALTELRTFAVSNVKTEHSANLSNAIIRMNHLVHLEIAVLGQKEVLHLEGLCLPPTISWLALEGQLEKTSMRQVLSSWSHLNSLTRLHLSLSEIDEASFPGLLMLRNLCSLALINAFEGKKLHFCAGSFPKLRYLFVHNAPRLNQSVIEEGAMQCLALLVFRDCPELKLLPHGIEHLTGLEELRLEEASEELLNRLQQKGEPNECSEDLLKISHIRKVTVELTKKGISERIR
jgi:disease resistance protein RPM1